MVHDTLSYMSFLFSFVILKFKQNFLANSVKPAYLNSLVKVKYKLHDLFKVFITEVK